MWSRTGTNAARDGMPTRDAKKGNERPDPSAVVSHQDSG